MIILSPKIQNSVPSNIDYRYYVKEQNKIPKTARLRPEIYIKAVDAAKAPAKRILVCGTTDSATPGFFFAVYNTLYNITEYLLENPSASPEVCRGLKLDPNNNQVLLITDLFIGDPLEESCTHQKVNKPAVWRVSVRAFSLDRMNFFKYVLAYIEKYRNGI